MGWRDWVFDEDDEIERRKTPHLDARLEQERKRREIAESMAYFSKTNNIDDHYWNHLKPFSEEYDAFQEQQAKFYQALSISYFEHCLRDSEGQMPEAALRIALHQMEVNKNNIRVSAAEMTHHFRQEEFLEQQTLLKEQNKQKNEEKTEKWPIGLT